MSKSTGSRASASLAPTTAFCADGALCRCAAMNSEETCAGDDAPQATSCQPEPPMGARIRRIVAARTAGAADPKLYCRPVGIHPGFLGVTSRSERFPPHPTSQLLNVAYLFRVRLRPITGLEGFRMYSAARPCITVGVAVLGLNRRADPMRRSPTVSLLLSCLQSKS